MAEFGELWIPENDCANPELSLVIPALNEEITIGRFVEWCFEGLKKAEVEGEILIVNSSTDATGKIALSKGARVFFTPKRGLGRAYIDALSHIRGKYVIMGDCDCTYDFRELRVFVEEFRKGTGFIMGSRFKGSIEEGAMPSLHRYFGTPVTTAMLNFLYGSQFSDIHCGMRGVTREVYERMNLQSQTWEYASEMIIKAQKLGIQTAEVPVKFLKDMEGRKSHYYRAGVLGPWIAGWQTLRIFFLYRPDFFLRKPGYLLSALGLLLVFGLSFGPVEIGPLELSIHAQVLGLLALASGLGFLQMDAMTTLFLGFNSDKYRRLKRQYQYDRAVPYSGVLIVAGFLTAIVPIWRWMSAGFKLRELSFGFVAALGLILLGFQLFLRALTVTLFSLKDWSSERE